MDTILSPEDEFPGMLLHQAALWDNYELLEDLLRGEQSIHINGQDSWGRTPLHAAAITNNSRCLGLLLRSGADPNIPCGPRGELRTALHISAKFGFVSNIKTLLEFGATLVAKDKLGLTPLDIAERSEHSECVTVLQQSANERENVRQQNHSALREACLKKDVKLAEQLLERFQEDKEAIVNLAPNGANTLLFMCCEMNDQELVTLLLTHGADGRVHPITKYSPLYISCYSGHYEIAELLLKKFPELICQWTVEKWLPIHAACIGGHSDVLELILNFNYPRHLLMKYSDSNHQWEYEIAFDINMKDASGQTPLYLTCLLGNVKMCELLLKYKVKAKKINSSQEGTPTETIEPIVCPGKKRISGGIQNIMSKLNLRVRSEGPPKRETEKEISPILLDVQCSEIRETALHISVRQKCHEIVALLLGAGADPNISIQRVSSFSEDDMGVNCLVEAAKNRDIAMVDLLLRHGARDDFSKALTVAVMNQDDILIAKLLSTKAHPDPEYKLNKKVMTEQLPRGSLPSVATLTYSSVFPNTPVMINWHGNRCLLNNIKSNWLVDAAIIVNPKLKLNPKNHEMALFAITRLDLSNNALTSVPIIVFQLPSLRYLNLSQNKLEKFPHQKDSTEVLNKNWKYNNPVLEELCVQNNRLEFIPGQIFRLPSLNVLDISNNKLQSLPPDMWTSPSLKELNASFNLLKDLPTSYESCRLEDGDAEYSRHTIGDEGSVRQLNRTSPIPFRNYQIKDLKRQNMWSSTVEIAEQIAHDHCQKNCSQLSSLNLAHNLFTSVPPLLACLAVNLTRLNMSYNSLRSMSHVTTYPNSLKQLDLSYNAITRWPSLPQVDTLDSLIMCYSLDASKTPKLLGRQSGVRSFVLHSLCSHRRHVKFDNLRTLIVADNCLEKIQLTTDDEFLEDGSNWDINNTRSKLLFPILSMLDISNNKLKDIPNNIYELTNLSVLNISGNLDVNELPAQMGLLSRLWNLNTSGCNLQEPLKTMIESKKYKTMDVIGYLKSVLEDARPYARMKLMIVGVQGIGKTSLLEQLRQEGLTIKKRPHEHWAKRMGNKNINVKTHKGINMSTVGVDIGLWMYDKKTRGQSSKGPVLFRTWDFGGQKEYYATHQYFLSKRSLYLVVWKISDGEKGIREIRQWLVNIQARAPNSPVLIVGTHYDEVIEKNLVSVSEELQQQIRERFINVVDAEKCGLPRVLDTIEVSCRTHHNVKVLCNLIYDTAFSLRPPGSKELLLEQRIPASYLALEDVVVHLAAERRASRVDPVLNAEQYKAVVSSEMQYRFHKTFRDWSELYQATIFLHENGVLLHYEDATLRDLYFLDPQWLCDMLAHVVTIREINPFARSGLMKLTDLKHVFKPSNMGSSDSRGYIVNLLNKFEVALTWDNCTLLIPSLLPSEEDLFTPNASTAVRVKIPVRSRGWAVRSKKMMISSSSTLAENTAFGTHPSERVHLNTPFSNIISPVKEHQNSESSNLEFEIVVQNHPEKSIRRLLLMSYFPSGFWSRLITRLLADDAVIEIVRGFFSMPKELKTDIRLAQWLDVRTEWLLWQTGMALKYGSVTLFQMKELLPECKMNPVDYRSFKFRLQQDGNWSDMDLTSSSILEIYFPFDSIVVKRTIGDGGGHNLVVDPNSENIAKLLALAVDHVDTLLEDWYPTLGTRFVHTSEGKFLVTRLIPCPKCISQIFLNAEFEEKAMAPRYCHLDENLVTKIERTSQDSSASDVDSGVGRESNQSSRLPSMEGLSDCRSENARNEEFIIFSWMVEECILSACYGKNVTCIKHGEAKLSSIAPDTIFCDLGERHLIRSENITKGSLLGRGAFGFVFKGSCKIRGSEQNLDVAMKMLQPVQPGPNARQSVMIAYKIAQGKWDRDPLQYACKAYCTARQELNILLSLRHPNIVPLIGVCTRPLALVLDLAPQGALDTALRNYRRSGDKIKPNSLQSIILQVAKAIEYLHQQHIIYRDLKSENVLVWNLPPPFEETFTQVHVKLADYGISRLTLPTGSKGFGGTEGFMAPEMMRFNGEEEYTEKVDCFSFGMFIYELLTLHQPFEGHESVKEYILEGGRPPLTHREIIYPSSILDLMVLCWTHQPRDRPSASQIVSMASSPEFIQLCDSAALDHSGDINAAVACPANHDDNLSLSEIWLMGEGGIELLSGTYHNWQAYKFIPFGVRCTSVAFVNNNVWIGDENGNLYAYDPVSYTSLWNYFLGDASIIDILSISELNRVAVGLTNGRLFLVRPDVTPTTEAMAEGSFVMTELGGSDHLFTLATIKIEENIFELWVGEAMGFISIFRIKDEIVSDHDRVNHYNPVIDRVERVHLVCSDETIYSYVYPGCMVYQWDVDSREISSTLDCTKLVPCSESLKPLTIEDLSEKCQVTSVSIYCDSVYIGTAWGCVIVAERSTLYPVMVFRPFEEEVKLIIPFFMSSEDKRPKNNCVVLVGRGYRSLSARNTDMVLTPSPITLSKSRKLHMHLLLWKHLQ